jgi:hypothetical protein
MGIAELDQARPFGMFVETWLQRNGAQFVELSAGRTHIYSPYV